MNLADLIARQPSVVLLATGSRPVAAESVPNGWRSSGRYPLVSGTVPALGTARSSPSPSAETVLSPSATLCHP